MKESIHVNKFYLSTKAERFEILAERDGIFIGYCDHRVLMFTSNGVAPFYGKDHGVVLIPNAIGEEEI